MQDFCFPFKKSLSFGTIRDCELSSYKAFHCKHTFLDLVPVHFFPLKVNVVSFLKFSLRLLILHPRSHCIRVVFLQFYFYPNILENTTCTGEKREFFHLCNLQLRAINECELYRIVHSSLYSKYFFLIPMHLWSPL